MADGQSDADPFDVFGEDDGDEDGGNANSASWNAGQVMAAAVNERLAKSKPERQVVDDRDVVSSHGGEVSQPSIVLGLETLLISSWKPPLYLGPIKLVTSLDFGGGRGYVAACVLEPGTLVMVEAPLIGWPTQQLGKSLDLVSIQHILESPNAITIVQVMEDFHPTKSCVDHDDETDSAQVGDMMTMLQRQYKDDPRLINLIELSESRQILNRDGSVLSEKDIFRLLLAVRYNGLESGIYCHSSMLNHDCFPNCVKFFPESSSYSEVRTTRKVLAGESLTISYVPRTLSHASRRHYLWEQHRFDIGVDYLKGKHRQMELIDNKLPPSCRDSLDEESTTSRIETATEELETLYHESMQALGGNIATGATVNDEVWEQIKALELSSLELCREAQFQLQNDRHILLVPCFRLHLDSCELVQRAPSMTAFQRLSVLGRQVITAQRLVDLQKDLHGDDHFDLARTFLDLANAIDELLSQNPKILYQLGQQQQQQLPTTFAAWSALQHQSRKQYERIRTLYPHDTEEHIQKANLQVDVQRGELHNEIIGDVNLL